MKIFANNTNKEQTISISVQVNKTMSGVRIKVSFHGGAVEIERSNLRDAVLAFKSYPMLFEQMRLWYQEQRQLKLFNE